MNSTMRFALSILATAIIVGIGTYYAVQGKAKTDKAALEDDIAALNKKVAALEKSPTPTATPSTSTSSVSDWKTYSNTAYYYSFKYPTTVSLYSTVGAGGTDDAVATTSASVHVKKSDTKIVEVSDLATSKSLTDYITSNWSTADKTVTDVTIAGTKGYKVVIANTDHYYYVEKSGKKLQISLDETDATAVQIVDTFTFTK